MNKTPTLVLAMMVIVLLTAASITATKTFTVQETDLVKMKVKALDPDNDPVSYTYSPPLNEHGEWQTGYDDAGEYNITITASDGKNQTTQQLRLIVKDRNRLPLVNGSKQIVQEGQTVSLKELVKDPDNDVLSFSFHPPFDQEGLWKTTLEDQGSRVAEFSVSDGKSTIKARVEIIIQPTNQPPKIKNSFAPEQAVQSKENQKLAFFVEAEDADHDTLAYQWSLDNKTISEKNAGEYYFDFDSEGKHELAVSVRDGAEIVTQQWIIDVGHGNRAPALRLLPIRAQEGDKVVFDLPETDADGDAVHYSAQPQFDQNLEWQTGYDDAGEHEIEVAASDGELTTTAKMNITILDKDRAPELTLPEEVHVREGETLLWTIPAADPDGDNVTIKVESVPLGATFNDAEKTLVWSPGYDTISRTPRWWRNMLNAARIEQLLLRKKSFPVTVTSCGKELCTVKNSNIVVTNVNRPPELLPFENTTTLMETQEIKVQAFAPDPDGDIVRYYYSPPWGKQSGTWKTEYGDRGNYTLLVTATDGYAKSTQPLGVVVVKKNRAPTITVKDELVVWEGQELILPVTATDPDNDTIMLWINDPPANTTFKDGRLSWTPSYDIISDDTGAYDNIGRGLAGTDSEANEINESLQNSSLLNQKENDDEAVVWLSFTASDGQAEVIHPVKVRVKNVNRKPEIFSYAPESGVTVLIREPVIFTIAVLDPDGDELEYSWDFGFGEEIIEKTNTVERFFVTPGEKEVKVRITDGVETVEKGWKVYAIEAEVPEPAPLPEPPFEVKVYVVEW